MPIYAYKCESCGHTKDVLQKMSDAQLTDCPTCGATSFKKQLTAAGFQLKGSGWYVTDFRGGSEASAGKNSESGATDSSSKSGEATAGAASTAASTSSNTAASANTPSVAPAPAPAASTASPAKGGT